MSGLGASVRRVVRAIRRRLAPTAPAAPATPPTPLPVIRTSNLPGAPAETATDPAAGAADRAAIARALRQLAPTFAMAYAGRGGAKYQIQMWEPYLAASGEPYVIVTVDERAAELIRTVSDAPLIVLPEPRKADLELALPPTVKAAFYVQNSKRNAAFLKLRRMTHVWLNHGDSDKPANFNRRHADYDRLVTAGEAGIDRYATHGIDIPRDRFDVLGRPQVSDIAVGPRAGATTTTVLYAPTWRGIDDRYDYTSLPLGPQIVQALVDREVTVIFRRHPFSARNPEDRERVKEMHAILAADKERTGRQHVWGDAAEQAWSVADCVNNADALVSDVCAVVTDFLASGRPYAMVAMSEPDTAAFRTAFPLARSAYVVERDLGNLNAALHDLLVDDPLAALRAERRTYYLGPHDGEESAAAVAAYVRRLGRRRHLRRPVGQVRGVPPTAVHARTVPWVGR